MNMFISFIELIKIQFSKRRLRLIALLSEINVEMFFAAHP